MIATLKITMSKWQHCKFDNWRWLFLFLFCCERKWTKNNCGFTWKVLLFKVTKQGAHTNGDAVNVTTVACRISSWFKWFKNYKNRLRLAKVIVKNKMSRFFWFTVYMPVGLPSVRTRFIVVPVVIKSLSFHAMSSGSFFPTIDCTDKRTSPQCSDGTLHCATRSMTVTMITASEVTMTR